MSEGHDVLTEVYVTVKAIERKLDAHIQDEMAEKDRVLYPMYEAFQQQKGAVKFAYAICAAIGGGIVAGVDYLIKK